MQYSCEFETRVRVACRHSKNSAPVFPMNSSPIAPRTRRGAALNAVLIVLVIFLVLGVAVGGCAVSKYNTVVAQEPAVEAAWTEVQNQYQRRSEMIPQLVSTVKGAADFEKSTITEVTEARASVGQMKFDGLPKDQAELDAFVSAQSKLGSSLSRLLVVAENYPQLTATSGFRDLQTQIEGTENRIGVARGRYIKAVKDFNTMVVVFPTNIIAGMVGLEKKPQLSTPADVAEVPAIDFGSSE